VDCGPLSINACPISGLGSPLISDRSETHMSHVVPGPHDLEGNVTPTPHHPPNARPALNTTDSDPECPFNSSQVRDRIRLLGLIWWAGQALAAKLLLLARRLAGRPADCALGMNAIEIGTHAAEGRRV
jgi:hypothetical protein